MRTAAEEHSWCSGCGYRLHRSTRAGLRGVRTPVFGLAALFYVVAGFEVFEVVLQQRLAELEDLEDPFVGDGVVGVSALAAYLHVAAPGQAAQVVGDPRLRRAELAPPAPRPSSRPAAPGAGGSKAGSSSRNR